jgi:hypothetical protein
VRVRVCRRVALDKINLNIFSRKSGMFVARVT